MFRFIRRLVMSLTGPVSPEDSPFGPAVLGDAFVELPPFGKVLTLEPDQLEKGLKSEAVSRRLLPFSERPKPYCGVLIDLTGEKKYYFSSGDLAALIMAGIDHERHCNIPCTVVATVAASDRIIEILKLCKVDTLENLKVLVSEEEALRFIQDYLAAENISQMQHANKTVGPSMIGEQISRYKILERLGINMGEIFLAEDTRSGSKVVIKIFGRHCDLDRIRESMRREVHLSSLVDHPNIQAVYETNEWKGCPFLVMEHMEGEPLKEQLSNGPIGIEGALEIGMQVCNALAALHSKGLIHGDITPARIFISTEGLVKLCDFHFATTEEEERNRQFASHDDNVESVPRIKGTPLYLAPEQLRGGTIDSRKDIFSFGLVLYEMLTGVHPFRRANMAGTVSAIVFDQPLPLSNYLEEVPQLLQETVEQMLVKDPADRGPSADKLQACLEQVRTQLNNR